MESVKVAKDELKERAPFAARWAQKVERPTASTSMQNPDTSTYNKSTEDNDT